MYEMNEERYKEMLGAMGKTFLGSRLFNAVSGGKKKKITLKDYLIYYDILYHGTDEEKNTR